MSSSAADGGSEKLSSSISWSWSDTRRAYAPAAVRASLPRPSNSDFLYGEDEEQYEAQRRQVGGKEWAVGSGVLRVVSSSFDELVMEGAERHGCNVVLGVSSTFHTLQRYSMMGYALYCSIIYLLPAAARVLRRYQQRHGLTLTPRECMELSKSGRLSARFPNIGASLRFGLFELPGVNAPWQGIQELDERWMSVEQIDSGLRAVGGFVMYQAERCEGKPHLVSQQQLQHHEDQPSSQQQSAALTPSLPRGVVMNELYTADMPTSQQRPLFPACHVHYPTLSSLLTWIHSTMRHDTFDLEEVLSLAAPWDEAATVLERFQRVDGAYSELSEKNPKLLSNKTRQRIERLVYLLPTRLVQHDMYVEPDGDLEELDVAAMSQQLQPFEQLMAEIRATTTGSSDNSNEGRTRSSKTTQAATMPSKGKQRTKRERKAGQVNEAEAHEVAALRQAPASVVSALLRLYSKSVRWWLLRTADRDAFFSGATDLPMWARELAMGGEDGPGVQEDEVVDEAKEEEEEEEEDNKATVKAKARLVNADHSRAAQRLTKHSRVEPDAFIRTLLERSASHILWFAGGSSFLLGLHTGGLRGRHQLSATSSSQTAVCPVLCWNFLVDDQPATLTANLGLFAAGQAVDGVEAEKLSEADQQAIVSWLSDASIGLSLTQIPSAVERMKTEIEWSDWFSKLVHDTVAQLRMDDFRSVIGNMSVKKQRKAPTPD